MIIPPGGDRGVSAIGFRGDPIYRGADDRNVLGDPVGQVCVNGVGERKQQPGDVGAVVRNVVAGNDGKARCSGPPPCLQRHKQANHTGPRTHSEERIGRREKG